QAELLDAGLVGGDGGALDAHAVLLDRVGGVDGDLVVGGVAGLDAQVVVLQVDVEVRQDQLVLDELPDDAGHLVAVELDDRVLDLDLRHGCAFLCVLGTGAAGPVDGRPKAYMLQTSAAPPGRCPADPADPKVRARCGAASACRPRTPSGTTHRRERRPPTRPAPRSEPGRRTGWSRTPRT